jgi:hypothetical protein
MDGLLRGFQSVRCSINASNSLEPLITCFLRLLGILFCLVNIGLAVYSLRMYPCQKILAVVVLWLEIASNIST